MRPSLGDLLGIRYSILVAPMFLVTNKDMVLAALDFGATAAIPALNFRTIDEMRDTIRFIRSRSDKPFGINLIVNSSNYKYSAQLDVLIQERVDFIITSLGNPKEVIDRCKPYNIKVFCDVVDLPTAQKVERLGADAVIAVNNRAGGHCGNLDESTLLHQILQHCSIPVISAGGIATSDHFNSSIHKGAAGVSVGTIFLASNEAKLSPAYQQALIQYGKEDIVLTTKLSGSPLTVINTPYVQSIGTKANFIERFLLSHKRIKKYVKLFIAYRGMRLIGRSIQLSSYSSVWCAGPSIEYIHSIRPMKEILSDLVR